MFMSRKKRLPHPGALPTGIRFPDIAALDFIFHNISGLGKDISDLRGALQRQRFSGPRRRVSMNRTITGAAVAALLLGAAGTASAADWFPYAVEVWDPPFDMASPRTTVDYV